MLDHTINHLIKKIGAYAAPLSGEFFERLGQYAMIKTRIAIEEPKMYHILYDVYVNLPEEIKDELMERYGQLLSDQRKSFMLKMDASRLREGVTAETAATIITDFLDGYYQRNLEVYTNDDARRAARVDGRYEGQRHAISQHHQARDLQGRGVIRFSLGEGIQYPFITAIG